MSSETIPTAVDIERQLRDVGVAVAIPTSENVSSETIPTTVASSQLDIGVANNVAAEVVPTSSEATPTAVVTREPMLVNNKFFVDESLKKEFKGIGKVFIAQLAFAEYPVFAKIYTKEDDEMEKVEKEKHETRTEYSDQTGTESNMSASDIGTEMKSMDHPIPKGDETKSNGTQPAVHPMKDLLVLDPTALERAAVRDNLKMLRLVENSGKLSQDEMNELRARVLFTFPTVVNEKCQLVIVEEFTCEISSGKLKLHKDEGKCKLLFHQFIRALQLFQKAGYNVKDIVDDNHRADRMMRNIAIQPQGATGVLKLVAPELDPLTANPSEEEKDNFFAQGVRDAGLLLYRLVTKKTFRGVPEAKKDLKRKSDHLKSLLLGMLHSLHQPESRAMTKADTESLSGAKSVRDMQIMAATQNPIQQLTLDQVINHPWFQGALIPASPFPHPEVPKVEDDKKPAPRRRRETADPKTAGGGGGEGEVKPKVLPLPLPSGNSRVRKGVARSEISMTSRVHSSAGSTADDSTVCSINYITAHEKEEKKYHVAAAEGNFDMVGVFRLLIDVANDVANAAKDTRNGPTLNRDNVKIVDASAPTAGGASTSGSVTGKAAVNNAVPGATRYALRRHEDKVLPKGKTSEKGGTMPSASVASVIGNNTRPHTYKEDLLNFCRLIVAHFFEELPPAAHEQLIQRREIIPLDKLEAEHKEYFVELKKKKTEENPMNLVELTRHCGLNTIAALRRVNELVFCLYHAAETQDPSKINAPDHLLKAIMKMHLQNGSYSHFASVVTEFLTLPGGTIFSTASTQRDFPPNCRHGEPTLGVLVAPGRPHVDILIKGAKLDFGVEECERQINLCKLLPPVARERLRIPEIHGVFFYSGWVQIVMDDVGLESTAAVQKLYNAEQFSTAVYYGIVCGWAKQLVTALHELHTNPALEGQQRWHGDLKAENVCVKDFKTVCLVDWGCGHTPSRHDVGGCQGVALEVKKVGDTVQRWLTGCPAIPPDDTTKGECALGDHFVKECWNSANDYAQLLDHAWFKSLKETK